MSAPGLSAGSSPPASPKLISARAALVDEAQCRGLRARHRPAANRDRPAQPPRHARLGRQTDDDTNAPLCSPGAVSLRTQTPPGACCHAADCDSAPAPAAGNTSGSRGSAGRTRGENRPRCMAVHATPRAALRCDQIRDAARHRRMVDLARRHQAKHSPGRLARRALLVAATRRIPVGFLVLAPAAILALHRTQATPPPAAPPDHRCPMPAAFNAHSTDHVP